MSPLENRPRRRANVLAAVLTLMATALASGQATRFNAPNLVEISPTLVTSGQPTAEALGTLKARGFEAVIYLAPPTVPSAVRDEGPIVTRQGLTFINIPIKFDDPTDADFEEFAAALQSLDQRKTLVHCEVNLRASTMVFLYRAIVLKEDPRVAYEALSGVWVPHGPWRQLIEEELRRHKVTFELL
jgi:protein tyrosine phosphatase (PTP) superfamily phosphohydrolase (DUF442 family)